MESHSVLWRRLLTAFGPTPARSGRSGRSGQFGDVHRANTFLGYYLRLELLSRAGLTKQLIKEMKSLFLEMVERTGTLWENVDTRASCNQGFASHAAH